MKRIEEISIYAAKSLDPKINKTYKIQGIVQSIKYREFSNIQKVLVYIKLINDGKRLLINKWISEQDKESIEKIRTNSKIEVIGIIQYDSYSKENTMIATNVRQL